MQTGRTGMSQETAKVKKSSIVELAAFLVFILAALIVITGALTSRDWGFTLLLEVQIIVIGIVVFWRKRD